jgi:hypothetical protein
MKSGCSFEKVGWFTMGPYEVMLEKLFKPNLAIVDI